MFNRIGLAVSSFVLATAVLTAKADAQNTLASVNWQNLSTTQGYTDFKTFEAVNSTGGQTYTVNGPMLFEGIVLNNPADMTDSQAGNPVGTVDPAQPPTSIPFDPNPYWQVYLQSVDVNKDGDFGGAAVYAAQNYGNVNGGGTGASYTAQQWYQEVNRISNGVANNLGGTNAYVGSPIVAGDLVIVEALGALSFGGKEFINEEHDANDPNEQFQFINLGPAPGGLPTPTPVTIAQLYNNTSSVYFDPTRQVGAEHYESTLVSLLGVKLVPGQASDWVPNGFVMVEDSNGLEFPLELGTSTGFDDPPTGYFDVTGIFDKESPSSGTADTTGYQLWVMDPTTVTPVPEPSSAALVLCGGAMLLGTIWRRRKAR